LFFFTSDTHFGHGNIVLYCKRPWLRPCDSGFDGRWVSDEIKNQRTAEMDEELIESWNKVVSPSDVVYHMGDFAFAKTTEILNAYIGRLNGAIHLIKGNHDHSKVLKGAKFATVNSTDMVKCNDHEIFLSHYAHRVWNKSHRGSWHLYGHSHGTLPDIQTSLSIDVGMDCRGFRPMSFDEVEGEMLKKTFVAEDCHGDQKE
jgi:calcineurin-like phosphoesterase family protein